MDETYLKVKGKWTSLYRAIDEQGKTFDFILSNRCDKVAARFFFRRATETNGLPSRIVIDKIGANLAGLQLINIGLKFSWTKQRIEILCVKYLNRTIVSSREAPDQLWALMPFIWRLPPSRALKLHSWSERSRSNQTKHPRLNSLPAWPHKFIQNFVIITFEQTLRQNPLYRLRSISLDEYK